jgi:hypothetical protein
MDSNDLLLWAVAASPQVRGVGNIFSGFAKPLGLKT